jgi:hypothetical protein
MSFVEHLLVLLHLVGLAAVLGGFLVQIRATERRVLPLQWHGILTQVVTGVLLAGVVPQVDDLSGDDFTTFNIKIGVKLVLAVVTLVLIAVNRKRATVTTGVWAAIGGIELANLAIALFWTVG